MNKIAITTPDKTPAASLPLLDAVKKQLGVVSNLMRLMGNSSAALEGYLNLNAALAKGKVDTKTRERIALVITEIAANRSGHSSDPKADAAAHFTTRVALQRGHVSDADLDAVKAAGYNQAEIVKIVLHVALNTLTNYINEVAQTEIDFPVISAATRAAA